MKRNLLFFVSIIFTGLFPNAQQLIFKTYTIEDGLVSNPVRRIYQDKKGFLWIGTWEGLSKYDGYRFTNYTTTNGLSHNMINDLYESTDGKIYVAENNGSVDIVQDNTINMDKTIQHVIINQFSIAADHKVLAATDLNGLYEMKNERLVKPQQVFADTTYNDVTDLNDSLLIAGTDRSLYVLTRDYRLFSEIKLSAGSTILKLFKDKKNRVWVGTNNGLRLVAQQNAPLRFYLKDDPFHIPVLSANPVNDILEDGDNNLWIATSRGMIKIQPENNWQLFSEQDGLPSGDISCIYLDKEKNIWIGTALGLAKLVTRNSIHVYTTKNGLASNNVNFLHALKENEFIFGSPQGVQLYNTTDKMFSTIRQAGFHSAGFVENSQPLLLYDKKIRFKKYNPVKMEITDYHLQGQPPAQMFCSVMDEDGNIFCGTPSGLVIHTGQQFLAERKLSYNILDLLIDKKGWLWAGTWNNGIFRLGFDREKKIVISVEDLSYLLPDKNVRCIMEDSKGNIWIGTRYQGVVQIRNNGGKQYLAKQFDIRKGLTSNWIRALSEDANGSIWIGSSLGIDKLIPENNEFRVFNFSRLNSFFASINSILSTRDHSMWFSTNKGLVNVIDGELERMHSAPVYITSVNLGDTAFDYNTYQVNRRAVLAFNQNQAEFIFSAPSFINEQQILYSYRLFGSGDSSWSIPANTHSVSYKSLQPGSYRFEVRTIGWNGDWNPSANFRFTVQPPYWRSWWFYSVCGLLLLLLLYGFYNYRIRQLLKLQKVRNNIATDLHDDIGASLTNINMLSEICRKNLDHPKETKKFLQRITEEVTASSQSLNDIIWSINTKDDSIEEIMSQMRRYAAELFDNSNTLCQLKLDETDSVKKLNMEQRRDVYLIYKESLNNIRKHAQANHVWIEVHCLRNKLQMNIKDDGKGFECSEVTNRNGLKNIRSRTKKWKGSTVITSSPGAGTCIEVILPLAR